MIDSKIGEDWVTDLDKLRALEKYAALYSDLEATKERFIAAINAFCETYGTERDIALFSVPGRSEIIGNHTDHNNGRVLAGAIDRDVIAVVSKNDDGVIRFHSEGYPEDKVEIKKTNNYNKENTTRSSN